MTECCTGRTVDFVDDVLDIVLVSAVANQRSIIIDKLQQATCELPAKEK
jgi:hypothetical protein